MATNEASPLPQYYGQQLLDGTMMSPPTVPRHGRGSEDRQELLRLPMQPHPAHIDQNLEPISPTIVRDSGVIRPHASRRLGGPGFGDPNEYSSPSAHRQWRGAQSQDIRNPSTQVSHRRPHVEDYPSDEEEYEMRPRRRPSRQHRLPPSAYENDPRYGSRYAAVPGRGSFDPGRGSIDAQSPYNNDKPRYHMSYGSEDEYAQRRLGLGGNGRGPPRNPPSTENVMRLPWMLWMGSNAKNHFVAFVGEFVGTTMFLFFAFAGTQVANIGASSSANNSTTGEATGFSPEVLIYISVVFGFSLMVNVWVFFRISGGLFNPAVTFAMLLTRSLSPVRAFLLLAAQLSGSIFSSFLVSVLFPTPFNVRTTLSKGTSIAQGVFIEAILTAELVFTIFMLAKEKHKATFIAPVGIGLALFIAELVGVYYTGGSLNPARSFGPCVITGIFDAEHWIYWVGPAVGAVIAVVFYKFIKMLEYEVANPGQDDDDKDQEIKEVREKTTDPEQQ